MTGTVVLDRPRAAKREADATPVSAGRPYLEGVAVVMPAYKEEENLEATVEDFLQTLDAGGHAHCIVVVDDGSPDGTGEVLDRLAARHGERVLAVHHEVNQGYGAAVRTGIAAALTRTRLRRILLTDSDGQFHAADLLTFLRVQRGARADAVIGYREERADPFRRKVNAFFWTMASRLLLRTGSRDVDCAYKLIDRRLLEGVILKGQAAAISPEVLAKIRAPRRLIVEHPVQHYPRLHGDQTGAKLSVVLRSLVSLGGVYVDLVRERRRWARVQRALRPAERGLAITTGTAAVVSVAASVFYYRQGTALAYPDAISHLLISRRVLESPTAGAAQLGGVWLPLPHLLSLPLMWSRPLYESGFAATAVSMGAFVATARYLYRLAASLGGSSYAGLVAALLFVGNANTVYLQSTPMTEMLLLGCIAAAVYHLHEWTRTGRYGQLAAASVATLLATLTRYEGWILCVAVCAVVAYTLLRNRHESGYQRFEAHMIFFGIVAFGGIAAWLLWNFVIFGDPLNFQNGDYAKPSLWVSADEPALGDWGAALRTYLQAMAYDMGWPALGLAALGLGLYVTKRRRSGGLAPLVLLTFLPFFVYAIYAGQRPLLVPEVGGLDLYNVRFGIVMVLATALFGGYLAGQLLQWVAGSKRRPVPLVAVLLGGLVAGVCLSVSGTATRSEALAFRAGAVEQGNARASAWWRENYDGGLVLMESFGNESVAFDSRIPTERIVYEGSFRRWEPALENPARHDIRWVYLRRTPGSEDDTWRALADDTDLADDYVLVYEDADRQIYRRD